MGQDQKPKKSLMPGGDSTSSRLMRVVVFAVIGFIVVIFGLVGYTMLTAGEREYPQKLNGLLQTQFELMRISEEGASKGRGTAARNLALNTNLTVLTDHNELTEIVTKTYKLKVTGKTLGAKANEDTDEALADAEASNRYDEVMTEILQQSIDSYKEELSTLYDQAKSTKEKALLQKSFEHMELLSKSATQQ